MSAGKKTKDRSLMMFSRSVSRNSRTRFKFFLEENTSNNWAEISGIKSAGNYIRNSLRSHFDVLVLEDT